MAKELAFINSHLGKGRAVAPVFVHNEATGCQDQTAFPPERRSKTLPRGGRNKLTDSGEPFDSQP